MTVNNFFKYGPALEFKANFHLVDKYIRGFMNCLPGAKVKFKKAGDFKFLAM